MSSTLPNERQTFDERVIPLAKKKFNLNLFNYASLEKVNALLKDLFQLAQDLKHKNIQPVMGRIGGILRSHYKLMLPVVGFAADYLIRQLPIDEFLRSVISNKIGFILQSISISFRFALVFVFVFQCYEFYVISKSIQEALDVITDKEVKRKFGLIARNIQRLKTIADEVDGLIKRYEQSNDHDEMDRLFQQINDKLEGVNENEYRETVDEIGDLRTKIETQQQMLNNDSKHVATGGILSTLGVFSILAIDLIPVVGTITTAISIVSYTTSLVLAIKIKDNLIKIQSNLKLLTKYEQDLEEVMKRIKDQQEWMLRVTELGFEL